MLSGTPMVDDWTEIIDILNLLKNAQGSWNMKFRNNKLLSNVKLQAEFGEKIKGYISFLRAGMHL